MHAVDAAVYMVVVGLAPDAVLVRRGRNDIVLAVDVIAPNVSNPGKGMRSGLREHQSSTCTAGTGKDTWHTACADQHGRKGGEGRDGWMVSPPSHPPVSVLKGDGRLTQRKFCSGSAHWLGKHGRMYRSDGMITSWFPESGPCNGQGQHG